jgi:hypothetical protein
VNPMTSVRVTESYLVGRSFRNANHDVVVTGPKIAI